MPTTFTHIFVSGVFGKTYRAEPMPKRFWVLAAFCSALPDIDIIGYYFGIKYSDMLGHRGFAHSLTFALLVSVLVVVLAFPHLQRFSKNWWGMIAFYFFVTASHGFLDSMTDKGMGVGFFIPFNNARYYMPWRPIFASPMKISHFFSRTGLEVLYEEIIWIWAPFMLFYAGAALFRRRKRTPPAA